MIRFLFHCQDTKEQMFDRNFPFTADSVERKSNTNLQTGFFISGATANLHKVKLCSSSALRSGITLLTRHESLCVSAHEGRTGNSDRAGSESVYMDEIEVKNASVIQELFESSQSCVCNYGHSDLRAGSWSIYELWWQQIQYMQWTDRWKERYEIVSLTLRMFLSCWSFRLSSQCILDVDLWVYRPEGMSSLTYTLMNSFVRHCVSVHTRFLSCINTSTRQIYSAPALN